MAKLALLSPKNTWPQGDINISFKSWLYDTVMCPVLLYAYETVPTS